jgi:hypothetical protein
MDETKVKLNRRSFLLAMGASGAAGAAAIVAKAQPQALPASSAAGKRETKGYQASAHIRNYYRTAKV